MKKLFVISIMLVATIAFATAQQQQRQMGTPEERAKREVDRLTELLKLTADQKTKIQAIELDLNKQMDTKRQAAQGDREAMRTAMQEIQKLREEKFKPVLTADQLKKYLEDREQRQREREQRQGQGGQRQRNN
jgi:ABC-type transporter MlaC component